MPKFGKRSESVLATCDVRLKRVMREVIKFIDISALSGYRILQEQRIKVSEERSKTMNSKHLSNPSLAIDIAPYPTVWSDRERFTYMAGIVMGIAFTMGIKLRWGGDWNRDTEVKDNSFDVVNTQGMIGDLPGELWGNTLDEMIRVLKPGGLFMLCPGYVSAVRNTDLVHKWIKDAPVKLSKYWEEKKAWRLKKSV